MRGIRGFWPMALLGALLQACASAPRGSPELVVRCDQLFPNAPEALPILSEEGAPELRNPGAVASSVKARYHTRLSRVAVVQALVQPDGGISHACVLAESGDPGYDRAALEAASRTRWDPAVRDGEAVEAWVSFPVVTRVEMERDPTGRYLTIADDGRPSTPRLSGEDVEIQALVVDYLLRNRDGPAPAEHNEALCVGVGPGMPLLDPPAGLTERLSGASIPVVPATACRIDLDHEFPGMRRPRLLLERTGAHAVALWTDLPEHKEAGTARVRAGSYTDGPTPAGYECTVRRRSDAWQVVGCLAVGSD